MVLKSTGATEVRCLVATDDEAFTYNKRVNHLATVQEHFMIVQAIAKGVSEEKLAKVLNADIKHIRIRRTMLEGICPEVVDLLKDKSVSPQAFQDIAQDETSSPDRGGRANDIGKQLYGQLC